MIGANLELLLNELELTPEEFGDAVGVGKSPIYKLLRGDVKKITKRMAQRINNAFPQYDINYLISINYKVPFDIADTQEGDELSPHLIQLFEKAILLKEDELLQKSTVISTWLTNKELAIENRLLKEIKFGRKSNPS